MILRIFIILTILHRFTHADDVYKGMVYFPEESLPNGNRADIPSNVNLTEIRGTSTYEKYVEEIIVGGITKLSLAINKILLQSRTGSRDNIVFSPMSISGALALLLLGSNGKTYQEISNILGLASGLDIQSRSLQVHEQFGKLILKLERTSGFDLTQQVHVAQGVFIQEKYPIRRLYQEAVQQLYESEIYHVDFEHRPAEAQKTINNWVSSRTKGKIRDILAETPTAATKVIIATAMYFKALWENPFFEGTTSRRPFYSNGRHQPSTAEVDMMANGGEFPYYKDPISQCEILGFPYQGNATVMYVIMPFNSDMVRVKQLESSLTAGRLKQLADSTRYTGAVVLFPKMKIESTIDLKSPLRALGLRSLFEPTQANLGLLSPGEDNPKIPARAPAIQAHPEFSNPTSTASPFRNMAQSRFDANDDSPLIFSRTPEFEYPARKIRVGSRINAGATESLDNLRQLINQQSQDNSYQNPGLYADKIIHKVYMDITETGTEAAASTSVTLSRDGTRVTFRVDCPFLFFIRHEETKTVLFWGSVNTPTPNY